MWRLQPYVMVERVVPRLPERMRVHWRQRWLGDDGGLQVPHDAAGEHEAAEQCGEEDVLS